MRTQLDKLRAKERQLKAQIQDVEAKVRAQTKRDDLRRCTLVGGCVLAAIEDGHLPADLIHPLLDQRLTTARDRQLFEFLEAAYHDDT